LWPERSPGRIAGVSTSWSRELEAVRSAQERTIRQIRSLESAVTAIIEATELTSTDDEHDPEGATIAYERAQALALLRQARLDLSRLAVARAELDAGRPVTCVACGEEIDVERISALPTAERCIACARASS
jgi:RNA polymerase-binding transcription factor DksA